MSYGAAAQSLIKFAKEYKGAAINVVIVGGTVALKQIVQSEKFKCPCVSPENLGGCDTASEFYNSTKECTKDLNYYYGGSHILFPAIALYFVGLFATPRLWKIVTGCIGSKRAHNPTSTGLSSLLCEINAKALLAPFTWIIVMFLDGKYYACAVTPLPYDVGTNRAYKTCTEVAMSKVTYTSDAFNTNVVVSQIIGWFIFAFLAAVGFVAFALASSSSPLTYYHSKYFKIYRENEEFEINDEMKIKAQIDAENNVREFMSSRREKDDWDSISKVYKYHLDKKNLSVYSCLHQWVLTNQTTPRPGYNSIEGGPGVTSETIQLVPK